MIDLKKIRDDWCNECKDNLIDCVKSKSLCFKEYLQLSQTIALQEIAEALKVINTNLAFLDENTWSKTDETD